MELKSSKLLVAEALKEVNTISPEEGLKKVNENKCTLIDIRDANELQQTGKIKNSINIHLDILFKVYIP